MSNDDALRSELEDIQLQMGQKTDASLESTRRMVQMANEGVEVGVHTMDVLDQQGEQLDRIEEGMDKINTDLQEAENNLNQLDKCCGLCVMPWKRRSNAGGNSEFQKDWKKNNNTDGVTTKQPGGSRNVPNQSQNDGPFIDRITNDAREDEMDDNLREVSNLVANMRSMAVDMGDEIGNQNDQLERLNRKAEINKSRVEAADSHARTLI